MQSGNGGHKLFPLKIYWISAFSMIEFVFKLHTSEGIWPDNWFSPKAKRFKFTKLPIDDGISPFKLL